ncbi:carbon starvation protein A [Rhodanobacter sp. FW510-R12]|uniref:carbon starvation CstA family protein n=1 Tax=unclassified Rhodanobacter TaxID=2621553 RepID=UPI0007AA0C2E|nr:MULTISPECIES: carbon starvation CstA family protein [unclassified Rhodanobacter]KZC16840.1 carbon starvation protein A [Rhodanobacter sp. FW104-R8]KZC27645.1 carbon starvation protein A [Rhodanobacter sp. FW510-T8]KZC33483.1 carbon starvation protein A [Rhodanobacter sp. FW510-R10]
MQAAVIPKPSPASKILWVAIAIVGAFCLGVVALRRGEPINAIWLVAASIAIFVIGYRFYGKFVEHSVLQLDPSRAPPSVLRNDGLDYVPTDKWVVFGHHFAAIAGAGPLVGPVLAAQMGYLPGTLWILFGVVFAGAVQDFMILGLSLRRDARSLGHMLREELGPLPGIVAMIGVLVLMMIVLAVLALVVVKALTHSPWGTFTVAATIPIALLMGAYLRWFRPGRILEVSIIGLVLLLASIWFGKIVYDTPALATLFDFDAKALAWLLIAYGFCASVLPVWLLLAPRDYLSTFLKIGTIALLALAIFLAAPTLQLPAVTKFIDGTGPVFAGNLFPFLFITIACGAVSGWHSIIASGTTPKLLANEGQARMVGYGGMLMEAFVAIMALVAAASLHPGVYFAMNSPGAIVGTTVQDAATAISQWGFVVTPDELLQTAKDIGESSILGRAGGAPTLAVGMAQLLHNIIPGGGMMAFWYHYAILFEALFILTTVDAGTRVGRFMIQEIAGLVYKPLQATESWTGNLLATAICVALWGYFLYQGAVDPLGGINTLWPLFGIANQMLAAIALMLATVVVVKLKRERYVWVPGIPALWLIVCTLTAGYEKLVGPISFTAAANKYSAAMQQGKLLAPAKTQAAMQQIVTNNYVDMVMTGLFMLLVVAMVLFCLNAVVKAWNINHPTAHEEPYVALSSVAG